jgi:heptosyltransferase-2
MRDDFSRILVVRSDRMGDLVLTIPSLRALRKAFPSARICVWVDSSTRDLVDGLPFIDEVLTENRLAGWAGYWRHVIALRRRQFDLAIVYHTKKRNNAACFLAGIPLRLGYKNNKFGFLLNLPVRDERHLGGKHESEFCLDLLKRVGVEEGDLTLEVPVHSRAESWADALWEAHKLKGRTVVALHPDASCSTRLWPVDSFAALAARLTRETPAVVLVVGSDNASRVAGRIIKAAGMNAIDLTCRTTLAQLVSVLRRVRLLVSNDTGPVHVAAAAGTAVVSLFLRFQPGVNPERWRPLGAKSVLICNKPGEGIAVDRDSRVISGKFDSISVDEVFSRVSALIKEPATGK